MKSIGGYFELELTKGNHVYHQTNALKSGRSALHFILDYVKAKKVYIPFYTCDAVIEPIKIANIPFEFYGLNETLEPRFLPQLNNNEYFLYVNYLDLKRDIVENLSQKYTTQLIVDCSQAFFLKANGKSWYFNSCRKFFGVPDGSYLYAPDEMAIEIIAEKNKSFTAQHLIKRKIGEVKEGYTYFIENEILCGTEINKMSVLSEELLSHVDYNFCIQKRVENFDFLHSVLGVDNRFIYTDAGKGVPMYYPFLTSKKIKPQQLWDKNVFIPILWRDVLNRKVEGFECEKRLSVNLLALPIDHRYSGEDMYEVIKKLKSI